MNYHLPPKTWCDVKTAQDRVGCVCREEGITVKEEGKKPTSQYPLKYECSDNSISFLWILAQ